MCVLLQLFAFTFSSSASTLPRRTSWWAPTHFVPHRFTFFVCLFVCFRALLRDQRTTNKSKGTGSVIFHGGGSVTHIAFQQAYISNYFFFFLVIVVCLFRVFLTSFVPSEFSSLLIFGLHGITANILRLLCCLFFFLLPSFYSSLVSSLFFFLCFSLASSW